ncbi:MAG TPA: hypothetical protein VF779_21115 [Pyrinomonadaceae bacterium]
MAETSENIQSELVRRHRTASMVIGAMIGLSIALMGIAYFKDGSLKRDLDPSLAMALWITILIFGLGSFVLRRARFQSMRLKDIAALRGLSGLLATLQGTTIQIGFIGGAIALMGFMVTIITGHYGDMLRAGGVAIIVLISAFPQRSAWRRLVKIAEEPIDSTDDPPTEGYVA